MLKASRMDMKTVNGIADLMCKRKNILTRSWKQSSVKTTKENSNGYLSPVSKSVQDPIRMTSNANTSTLGLYLTIEQARVLSLKTGASVKGMGIILCPETETYHTVAGEITIIRRQPK